MVYLFPKFLVRLFKGPEKTIVEKLEDIEDEILSLESSRDANIDTEKRFVFQLSVYSFIIFGLGFILAYYQRWSTTQLGKLICITSIPAYVLLVALLRWGFRAFFSRKVLKTDERLKKLRNEKQKLLEEVMEKETFKKAQQILRRFDPFSFSSFASAEKAQATPQVAYKTPGVLQSRIRNRNVQAAGGDNRGAEFEPRHDAPYDELGGVNGSEAVTPLRQANQTAAGKPRLLRPILPRERTVIDKLIDALIGDGPNKRYALICEHCASHNGMALREEFEYLAFRCCYCQHFNPPRRARQKAPVPPNIAKSTLNLTPVLRRASFSPPPEDSTLSKLSQSVPNLLQSSPSPLTRRHEKSVEECAQEEEKEEEEELEEQNVELNGLDSVEAVGNVATTS
ncbi:unnamed protein product [Calicophoron daubneyi]|uniref:Endoplasmic reticulum junction formation protein lunapark n=1 Tax=Calicophoron daubneyi TaxID=300641 RepID=A0AAV2T9K0_CALDB